MEAKEIVHEADRRMKQAVDHTQHDFGHYRTGRANPSVLDDLKVEYYGVETPITQVSSVSVPEARQLVIAPYEKNMLGPIEKAILKSDLGVNPNNDGTAIRLNFPPMSEDRRRDLAKQVAHRAEEGCAAIRNVRKDAMNHLKQALKDKKISEDDVKGLEKQVQDLTDRHIAEVHALQKKKEAELLEV